MPLRHQAGSRFGTPMGLRASAELVTPGRGKREVFVEKLMIDAAVGLFVLAAGVDFVVAYVRRERLRERLVSTMHGHRLHEFTRSIK